MRKHMIAVLALALSAPPLSALADPPPWAPAHGRRAKEAAAARYDGQGRYLEPRAISRDDYVWRGSDGRYYCRRDNGTTGLVIGAAVGAVIGNKLDGGRNRTVGTILGAAGGALLGQSIDKGDLRCR